MKKVYVFLADGFEETEAVAPIDILRRAGADLKTVAVGKGGSLTVTSSHGIPMVCDLSENAITDEWDMIVLPGGAEGVKNLSESPIVKRAIELGSGQGRHIAAICAAPSILGKLGLARGVKMTCYPGWEKYLAGFIPTDEAVVTDGNYTTARAAGVSLEFGLRLAAVLYGKNKSDEVAKAIGMGENTQR